jgi:alpha-L-rhamnosidase
MFTKLHLVIYFILPLIFFSCSKDPKSSLTISKLTCEYSENPIAVDTKNPRFSWVLSSKERGQQQSAYQIFVADSKERITQNIGNIWDSGRQQSSQSVHIQYAGNPLKSNQSYYWKVKIWDRQGNESKKSKIATFHTGLLYQSDWIAKWIGSGQKDEPLPQTGFYQNKNEQYELPDTIIHNGRSVLFRKEFKVNKDVKSAFVFASGLGFYELYLNGQKVENHVLAPAKTNYLKQVLYNCYDVSQKIKKGQNAVGFFLGNGWYNPYKKWWRPYRMQWFGSKRAILQLHVNFADGSKTIMVTDDSWKSHPGPILFNCIYDGEIYDATQELPNWNKPFYDDTNWKPVNVVNEPGGKMVSHMMPPIKIVQEITPIDIFNPKPGIYVYDMGQNFAGWAKLKVSGPKGSQIQMRFAEDIYPDRNINITSNEHANATSTYIHNGTGVEIYEPRFTFFGFRYVEVGGFPGKPALNNLVGCAVHSN